MLTRQCTGHFGRRFVYLCRASWNPKSRNSSTGIRAHRSRVQCQSPPSGAEPDTCLCFPAPGFRCQPTDRTSGPTCLLSLGSFQTRARLSGRQETKGQNPLESEIPDWALKKHVGFLGKNSNLFVRKPTRRLRISSAGVQNADANTLVAKRV